MKWKANTSGDPSEEAWITPGQTRTGSVSPIKSMKHLLYTTEKSGIISFCIFINDFARHGSAFLACRSSTNSFFFFLFFLSKETSHK